MPGLLFLTCSRRISRGRTARTCSCVRSARLTPNLFGACTLRYGYLRLAVGWYPLFFYKELCFAFVVYIGFTNGEYHVVCVDFIAPCGGTRGQRRRTLRIPPSLSGTTPAWFGGRVRVQRIGKEGFANPAVPVLWCPRKEQ